MARSSCAMPHRATKRKTRTEEPPAAGAEVLRHLRALGLQDAEAYRLWCRQHGFRTTLEKSWQERRKERQVAEKEQAEVAARADLMRHVAALGLASPEEYAAWCRKQGFSDSLRKTPQQRRQEQLVVERAKAQAALRDTRRRARRPEETLQAIYRGEIDPDDLKNPALQKIHDVFAAEDRPDVREAFLRLLLRVRNHADLFHTEPALHHLGRQAGNTWIEALLALAGHHTDWLRPVEEWKPDTHNARRQFGSLARHLLARYFVPSFLDAAWFAGDTPQAQRQQGWFKHIGAGQNIRTADIPLRLTKMMAHHFLEAPDDTTIEQALRYGQILGLGGDEHLVRAVIATRLGETIEHDDFWVTVLHFFVNNPMLDDAYVGPVVDYIYHQRFVPREVVGPEGVIEYGDPPQPDFSMKGRRVAPLLELVEEWHVQLAREARKIPAQWESSGINGFRWLEDEGDFCWTIQELLTSKEVTEEGKAMHHCVGSYARSCAKGHTSVWAMQVEDPRTGARRRVMTISVQNARKLITQARGRCNRLPGAKQSSLRLNRAPAILQQWAQQEGLTVPKYL